MKIQAKDLSVGDVLVGSRGYFTFSSKFIVRKITKTEDKVFIDCQEEDGFKREVQTCFYHDDQIEVDRLNMN